MQIYISDVEKCQTEGFDWQNFIRTDKILIFLLHILMFGLTRFSKSVEMTGMSKKISTSLLYICYITKGPKRCLLKVVKMLYGSSQESLFALHSQNQFTV